MDVLKRELWLHLQQLVIDFVPNDVEVEIKLCAQSTRYQDGVYHITLSWTGRKLKHQVVAIYALGSLDGLIVEAGNMQEYCDSVEQAAQSAAELFPTHAGR